MLLEDEPLVPPFASCVCENPSMGFPESKSDAATVPLEGRAKGSVSSLFISLAELGASIGADLVVHESSGAGVSLLTRPTQALGRLALRPRLFAS
eukprot:3621091-Alexandrium_andersonii.AAC.1